jgi:hypothetical protein
MSTRGVCPTGGGVCVGGGVVEAKLHENEEGTFARHPDL